LGCCVAMWFLAGTAFVSSRMPRANDSSNTAARGHGAEAFRSFSAQPEAAKPSANWAPAMSLAAVFGIISVLAVAPVRAEEAAPAAAAPAEAPAAAPAAAVGDSKTEGEKLAQALSKEERVKKDLAQLRSQGDLGSEFESSPGGETKAPAKPKKKSSRPKVEKPKEKDEGGIGLPSFSAPSAEPAKKKVIISPADEMDEDEKPLTAPNPPLLIAILFGPSFIYLAFYVLGSLDII